MRVTSLYRRAASAAQRSSALTSFSDGSPVYVVTVATGAGSGTLRLDIPDTAAITDLQGNPLGGSALRERRSIHLRQNRSQLCSPSPAGNPAQPASPSVGFSVTFSEAVAGVAAD